MVLLEAEISAWQNGGCFDCNKKAAVFMQPPEIEIQYFFRDDAGIYYRESENCSRLFFNSLFFSA